MEKKSKNKYPRSKNNLQCLGPCYQKNTQIIHPITLDGVTSKIGPFCPIMPTEMTHPITKQKYKIHHDECAHATTDKDTSNKDYELNILTPTIDFNEESFLKIYYRIGSFEDAINWVDTHKYSSLLTRKRIIDCAWKAYYGRISLVDQRLVDFYIELVKRRWINYLYDKLGGYIKISGNQIILSKPETKPEQDDESTSIAKINFLIDRFIDRDTIYKFLNKVIKAQEEAIKTEEQIYAPDIIDIKINLVEYIENKIKLTIG